MTVVLILVALVALIGLTLWKGDSDGFIPYDYVDADPFDYLDDDDWDDETGAPKSDSL